MTFPAIYGAVSTSERDMSSMLLGHSRGSGPRRLGDPSRNVGPSLSEPRLQGETGVGRDLLLALAEADRDQLPGQPRQTPVGDLADAGRPVAETLRHLGRSETQTVA
jgi:hypothetical protein